MNEFEILPVPWFERYEDEDRIDRERGRIAAMRMRALARRESSSARARTLMRLKDRSLDRRHKSARPRPRPSPSPSPSPAQPPPWPQYVPTQVAPTLVLRSAITAPVWPAGSIGADDERWRCVQACFGRQAYAAPGGTWDGDATDGDATAPANEPGPSEFEYEAKRAAAGERASSGLMTLSAAIADPRAALPGVYTLFKDGQRLYVGRARVLRRRLQQHLLCMTHLDLAVGRFRVKLTPLAGASPAHLGRVESAVIGHFGRRSQGGPLTNVRSREF